MGSESRVPRKPHLWLIRIIGVIVPRRLRADWRQEWQAELHYREAMLADWDKLNRRTKLDLLWRSLGAFRDALWLQHLRWEDDMFQDLRYGVRMLIKAKGFTTVAVLSLALGIGANTALFQLLDAVRLRMLPVVAPQELAQVRISDMSGARGSKSAWYPAVTNPIWEQIRDRQQSFSGIFAWGTGGFNLSQEGEVRPAQGLWVSGDFFRVLGVRPALGRLFSAADDQRGCDGSTVVISYPFWQSEYAGDANVIGRKLMLGDQPFEIIGVTPASFFGLEVGRSFDVALPICAEAITAGTSNRLDSGVHWWLMVTGRLKPGVSLEQATAELESISPGLFQTTLPANYPPVSIENYLTRKLEAVSGASGYSVLRANYASSLWLLLAIAGLVLLIACANLANLLLARAATREREMAVREALGASRTRLVRQLLAESMLLAIIGATLGAALAQFLSRFLVSFLSTTTQTVFLDLGVDWRVLCFAAGLAVLTCVLFGLMPALRASRSEPAAAMKAGGRGLTASRERFSLRRALVVLQVALSLVLVAGAFLFTRSLNRLQSTETGFQQDNILITRMSFARLNIPSERRVVFVGDVLDRIKTIPGVEAATDVDSVPLSGGGRANNTWLEGTDGEQKVNSWLNRVGNDYFSTLRTPLMAGRTFDERDAAGSPKVAIVNEAFSRQLLSGANPLGRRFWVEKTPSEPQTLYEIVGLVKDTKFAELNEDLYPIVYLARAQDPSPGSWKQLLVRSKLPMAESTAAVKRVFAEINPAINLSFQPFKSMIEGSILRERLLATLSGFFGLLALLLAGIGLYGILSHGVASRTNEIGIRMALGAQRGSVLWLILREALLLAAAGVGVGLPVVFAVTRLAESLLYQLTPTDTVSLSVATIALMAVAFLAGYLPARRATRVDPMVALRDQ